MNECIKGKDANLFTFTRNNNVALKGPVLLIGVVCVFLAVSCRNIPENNLAIDSLRIGKIQSVAILGNSIVRHGPNADLGWTGDWGMAASSIDKDFVHLLIQSIHERDTSVKVQFENISSFEKNFRAFEFPLISRMKNSDMIIMKISENIKIEDGEESLFIDRLDSLINFLDPDHHAIRVICDGFWPKEEINTMLKDYALEKGYPFIVTSDLFNDDKNKALGLYKNADVAEHPSDKGMMKIKERIWAYVGNYF